MRKGQVTIFATLGLVILLIVGLFLFLLRDIDTQGTDFEKPDEISYFIKTCANNLLNEGVELASRQGGYIYTPEPFIVAYGFSIPIYNSEIDEDFVENQIEDYIDDNMLSCVKLSDFEGFDANLFSTSITELAISETLLTGKSLFIYDNKAHEVTFTRETRLKELLEIANKIIEIHKSEGVDLVALSILQNKYDLLIQTIEWPINTIVYYLEKENSLLGFAVEG